MLPIYHRGLFQVILSDVQLSGRILATDKLSKGIDFCKEDLEPKSESKQAAMQEINNAGVRALWISSAWGNYWSFCNNCRICCQTITQNVSKPMISFNSDVDHADHLSLMPRGGLLIHPSPGLFWFVCRIFSVYRCYFCVHGFIMLSIVGKNGIQWWKVIMYSCILV